jgi:hypothetical protein
MNRQEREARLQRVKALGRIAYRNVKHCGEIGGVITLDGDQKHFREFEEDGLRIELVEPFRAAALSVEWSSLLIRYLNSKVLEIRWDKGGTFKVVRYEPGTWERILFDWPEPIPL